MTILSNPLTIISKPETVEKLLSRINESPVRDQVISATLKSGTPQQLSNKSTSVDVASNAPDLGDQDSSSSDDVGIPDTTQTPCPCLQLKRESPVVSPLQIMAAAFAADKSLAH